MKWPVVKLTSETDVRHLVNWAYDGGGDWCGTPRDKAIGRFIGFLSRKDGLCVYVTCDRPDRSRALYDGGTNILDAGPLTHVNSVNHLIAYATRKPSA